MTAFLMIFRRFPTTFRRFPKISQNCSEGQTKVPEHFPRISENSRRCPKIAEGCQRLSRETRRCFDDTPTNLSTKCDITEIIDIFTCEDIISSHVRISYRFYQFVTTRYTTDFYIINEFYVRVARTISHKWVKWMSEKLFLPREPQMHIFELTCNVLFITQTYWWQRFKWFSEDFQPLSEDLWRFSKIVPKARWTFPNIFREFPKISKDAQRFPKIAEDFRGRPEDFSMIHQRI